MKNILKSIAAVIPIIILVVLVSRPEFSNFLKPVLSWIHNQGSFAPVLFILIYILCTWLFIPISILTFGAGFLFGMKGGVLVVSVAFLSAAVLSFVIGRRWGRGWAKRLERNPQFRAIDHTVGQKGWKVVLLTRLSAILPFTLMNIAYSLSQITLKDYMIGTGLGMIPGIILFVYIGSLASSIALLGVHEKSFAEWLFYGVGLVATVVVAFYTTRLAQQTVPEKNAGGGEG